MCEPETEIECAACDSVPIYIHTLHGQIFIFIFFTKFWNLFFYPIQEQKHYVRSGSDDLG